MVFTVSVVGIDLLPVIDDLNCGRLVSYHRVESHILLKQDTKYFSAHLWQVIFGMEENGGLSFTNLHGRDIVEVGISKQFAA